MRESAREPYRDQVRADTSMSLAVMMRHQGPTLEVRAERLQSQSPLPRDPLHSLLSACRRPQKGHLPRNTKSLLQLKAVIQKPWTLR